MATTIPDPGQHFRRIIEQEVSDFRRKEIDATVECFRKELEGIAARCLIDVHRYYDLQDNVDNVSITLKLPKSSSKNGDKS